MKLQVAMTNKTVLAVDVMGGDFGPSVLIPGALKAALKTDSKVILVGQEELINSALLSISPELKSADYSIVNATQVVEMHEKPSDILRSKKDSSIQVACRLVKNNEAHAVISAGHSGASVACGMFILGRIPGVERPALATILPSKTTPKLLLDVGANVECRPYHLFQFALMGAAFAKDILNYEDPSVGILSIGEEEGKGTSVVKDAYDLLKIAKNINFLGNVEGRDVFMGDVDVIVCDGFVGNIALKLSEGLAYSMMHVLKRELLGNGILPKIGTFLAKKAFKKFATTIDYAEYGGAPLLGLQGIAFVCHGSSNEKAIQSAVTMASTYVKKGTHERLVSAICDNDELTRFARSV